MEWLQIFRIGNSLLNSRMYTPVDAYFQQYYLPNYEVKQSNGEKKFIEKTPYTLDILIDFDKTDVTLESNILQKDKIRESIKESNYFTGTAGQFDSYYIVVPFIEKQKEFDKKIAASLKIFFEDAFELKENKKGGGKKRIAKGYEKMYEEMIKEKLLDENFKSSQLLRIRRKILDSEIILRKLKDYLDFNNLRLLIYSDKKAIEDFNTKDIIELKPLKHRLDIGKTDTIAYIQVRIVENGETFYLNKLPEYRRFCLERFSMLGKLLESNKQSNTICYFEQKHGDVYPVEFPRDNINLLKVSTDTTVNYKSNFKGERFLISKNAFNTLKLGAWYIQQNLTTKIGGKKHYIIPDFTSDFDLSLFNNELKPKIDLAFQDRNYFRTKRNLETISNKGLNALTFVGYLADDKKIEIINRIQTVTPDRFNQVILLFNEIKTYFETTKFNNWFVKFSFSSIYGLFPENALNTKVPQSLIFCKQLLENHLIEKNWILLQYQKLINIYYYAKADNKKKIYAGTNIATFEQRDYAIIIASFKFLILLKLIEKLYYNESKMNENFVVAEQPKTETFFNAFAFENSAKRAMFYLGKLIRRVAEAQSKAQHEHKPILNRINHSGMNPVELQVLSLEVIDKMRQYNKSQRTLNFAQQDLKYFEYYFCQAENSSWSLSDIENIFYLYTGYGMYWEVSDKKEVDAQKKVGIVQQENDFNVNNEGSLDDTEISDKNE